MFVVRKLQKLHTDLEPQYAYILILIVWAEQRELYFQFNIMTFLSVVSITIHKTIALTVLK